MLFNIKPLRTTGEVKREISRIIAKQRPNTPYDVAPFKKEVEEMLSFVSEFNPDWKKVPSIFRIAIIKSKGFAAPVAYRETIILPDTKHDLELVIKMLNYMRKEKDLKAAKTPLFIQPDEIAIAYKNGMVPVPPEGILSQMAVVFQKGTIMFVGFVFGSIYVLLEG